jgi:hypothetical protein
MSRSGIAEPYGSSIFSFLRSLHTAFPSDYTNLHSMLISTVEITNSIKGLLYPTPSAAFVVVVFLMTAILDWGEMESQCCFDLHFLYGKDVEHFFIHLLVLLLELSNSFTHSLIGLVVLLVFSFLGLYIFWILIRNPLYRFSPIL